MNKNYWRSVAFKILRAEMAKRNLGVAQLSMMLEKVDVFNSYDVLQSKMRKKQITLHTFLTCMRAMGVTNIVLDEVYFEEGKC